jgi:hypothetical protein
MFSQCPSTEGVVRVGDTVRRPHHPQSYAIAAYLDHLERQGFQGAPRYLGRDSSGRDVLTFIEGDVAGASEGVGDLIRRREQWLLANEDAIIGALVEERPTGDAGGRGASEVRGARIR